MKKLPIAKPGWCNSPNKRQGREVLHHFCCHHHDCLRGSLSSAECCRKLVESWPLWVHNFLVSTNGQQHVLSAQQAEHASPTGCTPGSGCMPSYTVCVTLLWIVGHVCKAGCRDSKHRSAAAG